MSFCVICTDLFDGVDCLNTAPCGHVFHSNCISRWVDQAGTCPECRRKITRRDLLLLFFNVKVSQVTDPTGRKELEALNTQLVQKEKDLQKQTEKAKALRDLVVKNEECIESITQALTKTQMELKDAVEAQRVARISVEEFKQKIHRLEMRNKALMNELELLNDVKTVVSGMQKDAESVFQEINRQAISDADSSKKLATLCSILKRELHRAREEKDSLRNHIAELKRDYGLKLSMAKHHKCEKKDSQNSPVEYFALTPNHQKVSLPQQSQKPSTSLVITPVSIPRSNDKITLVNLNKNEKSVPIPSLKHRKHKLAPIVTQKKDKDSISTTGYNGFGGHSSVIRGCIDNSSFPKPQTSKYISAKKRKITC